MTGMTRSPKYIVAFDGVTTWTLMERRELPPQGAYYVPFGTFKDRWNAFKVAQRLNAESGAQ